MTNVCKLLAWIAGSVLSAELLGYGLHRLLHSGIVPALSRNHMKHHLVLYGPLQKQHSTAYHNATEGRALCSAISGLSGLRRRH
jgi:hypothetical protein